MAGMTVKEKLTSLKTLFNDIQEVYFKAGEIKKSELEAESYEVDLELPVLEDGVNFDTGSADVTPIKLTTGTVWTSKAAKGDPDISFQVASVAGKINSLLMKEVGKISSVSSLMDGITYEGSGYSLAPKKVTGALVMPSEDRQTIIVLPNIEMYSSLVVADGDNPAYFNVSVTPMENSEGADIMVLWKKEAGSGSV